MGTIESLPPAQHVEWFELLDRQFGPDPQAVLDAEARLEPYGGKSL